MIKTGRIAVYETPNTPFVIRDYPLRDVKAGEVLVRISMSTICRSDLHSYQGHRPNPCPGILGHEIVGRIVCMGADVDLDLRGDTLSVGDRITWTMYCHEGQSYVGDILNLPQKSPGLRKYGHLSVDEEPHFHGGFADYCYILPETGILKLPDEISDAEAAPLNCGIATMVAVTEAAEIAVGDTVLVQGLGLLGLYGCALAKARGARRVIGLDVVAHRLETARRFGADVTLDAGELDSDALIARVREQCSAGGVDVGIEVCGLADVVPTGIRTLRVGGRYVIGGLVNPGSTLTLDGNEILRGLVTLKGVHNYHPRHLIQALDFLVSQHRRYPFAELVDARFPLNKIDDAFARAADHSALRAAVVPGGSEDSDG